MKKIIPLFVLLCFPFLLNAQDMLGMRSSNYAGIQGLGINPASIHTSRLDIDVNIIGIGVTAENDFVYIEKDKLKFFGIGNIIKKFDEKEYLDEFQFGAPDKKYNMSAAISVMGPGVMFNIKNKHTLAFTTQVRAGITAENVDGHIGKYAVEGLTYDPLHQIDFLGEDFKLNILSWLEYDLSYATTITESEKGALTGGITVKFLQGIGAGYARNANLFYDVLSDSNLIFQSNADRSKIDYGRTDYNSFDEISGYGDMVNGMGVGFDIGFTYDFLKDPVTWQYEMDGKKIADPTVNRYKLRLGLSVLDVGKIKFDDNSGVYHLETDFALYPNYNTDEYANNEDFDKTMSAIFYHGDSLASFRDDEFKMSLPSALSMQLDYNVYKKFYLNASYIYGFDHDDPGVNRPSVFALTPRYENKWIDVSLPFSYFDYNGKVSRLGIAVRFASFYIGSDRLGSIFGLSDLNGLDVYAGLKFSIHKERISDIDGDRVSDAKDKCKEIAGILKFEGCPDRDADDVPDAIDLCPDTKGLVALTGCPDRDGDGITDAKDDCADTPGLPQYNGCPDSDGDGIKDSEDDCPSIYGLLLYKGCPDTDNDSIPDPKDDCPTSKGLAVYKGCPDTDQDGLPDPQDDCPFDVGPEANKGCPVKIAQAPAKTEAVAVQLTQEEQEIINKVFSNLQFETGKAIIKTTSYESLDELAALMQKKPSFKLKIDGHTDNTGSASFNKTLSLKRAEAAKTYLVSKGVESSRITAKGYGKDKPVATNATSAGRSKNRRVEFLLIE
jgi:outer membrane protein OmpA-like peptidoglycan-associated protein